MLKISAYTLVLALISFSAHGQNQYEDYNQYGTSNEPSHRAQSFNYTNPRTHYNYFKASMGSASTSDYQDFSGDLVFADSSVLPINLAYGVSALNLGFEIELGFAHHEFEFIPTDASGDAGFGDLTSSKLMLNGFYKTSSRGSHLYVGAGIGVVSATIDGIEQELSGSALGTQFILGAELRTNERSALFIEYKNLSSVGMVLENDFAVIDYDFEESSINMGFRMYF